MRTIQLAALAAVLVAVAWTGNPMVARAVAAIAAAGAAIAWLSGAILAARGRIRLRYAAGHALLAAIAALAAAYLAIDRGQMLDLVVETWREGPAMR